MASNPPAGTAAEQRAWVARGGRAGVLAALAMLFAQLLWRTVGGEAGAPSLAETLVAAVARLTPLSVFGWATENLGSLAQNLLFAACLLGVLAVGYEAGKGAALWVAGGRSGSGAGGRIVAGLGVAAVLLLVAWGGILFLAGYGAFGTQSRHAAELALQFVLTFALFGVAWAVLAGPAPAEVSVVSDDGAQGITRRALIDTATARVAGIALLGGSGALAWGLARPRQVADAAASAESARAIEAAAEARGAAPVNTAGAVSDANRMAAEAAASPAAAGATGLPSFADLENEGRLTPRLTPIADFYHVSKNIADPVVSGDGWTLTIDGLVDTPMSWTLDELRERATVKNITTLGCISNELNGDLISTAEWTGVSLADLLAETGVKPEAIDLKFTCADDYQDSIPVAQGLDPETLLVVGMNGEPLPNDHGFPARMIVPPIYGMKNVKWLERIDVVAEDFLGYWQTRGWSEPAPYQIWGRIDSPYSGEDVAAGPIVAAGMAFAGDRGVGRVQVSLDEGRTWADAELEQALNAPYTWVRWRYGFEATAEVMVWIRVTDGEGNVAPQQENPPLPDGATGWPSRRIMVRA